MPAKRLIKKAIRRGVNPYAIANAMAQKHGYGPEKKEEIVHAVVRKTLKRKK